MLVAPAAAAAAAAVAAIVVVIVVVVAVPVFPVFPVFPGGGGGAAAFLFPSALAASSGCVKMTMVGVVAVLNAVLVAAGAFQLKRFHELEQFSALTAARNSTFSRQGQRTMEAENHNQCLISYLHQRCEASSQRACFYRRTGPTAPNRRNISRRRVDWIVGALMRD